MKAPYAAVVRRGIESTGSLIELAAAAKPGDPRTAVAGEIAHYPPGREQHDHDTDDEQRHDRDEANHSRAVRHVMVPGCTAHANSRMASVTANTTAVATT
jgi:hypothetical protein